MKDFFSKAKITLVFVLIIGIWVGACSGEEPPPPGPTQFAIVAPIGDQTIVEAPIQVQSVHPDSNISRVELWVREPGQPNEKLLRADIPRQKMVLQEWVPHQPGRYTLIVRAYGKNETSPTELTKEIEVLPNAAVSLMAAASPPAEAAEFIAPTVTASPPADMQVQDAAIVVVATATPLPSPTPIPRYPPPPPLPGVPPGPTQDELPEMFPPVCDAAEYIGVYAADTARRITITEPDQVAAKTVGGTLVHRAWRLQNVGTCTWGVGYELAPYGGRAMGSGGVAFESVFPTEPGRRNALVDTNRLIVPEGQPNQVAVLEVMLTAPVTPGIHQSYWRMRNPHGVYFGPIIGVTLEVVRDCEFGIYGAPVINKFEILGVGDVFRPQNPVDVRASYGQMVTLDWNIINATNFDVMLEDPTGDISALSNTRTQGRAQFRANELGEYEVTIYADNGPCTVSNSVRVDVVPPDDELFDLELILSPSSAAANQSNADVQASSAVQSGDVIAQWSHYDENVDKFILYAQLYKRTYTEKCPIADSILGYRWHCYDTWSEWTPQGQQRVVQVGGQGDAQGSATVSNVESNLCPDPDSYDRSTIEYGIQYVMRAEKDGGAAQPEFSNTVDTICRGKTTNPLRREIGGGASATGGFDPYQ